MCFFSPPSMPAAPTPAVFQPTQTPKDLTQNGKAAQDSIKRRGLFASIFTGPQGIIGSPMTTSTTGGASGTTGA